MATFSSYKVQLLDRGRWFKSLVQESFNMTTFIQSTPDLIEGRDFFLQKIEWKKFGFNPVKKNKWINLRKFRSLLIWRSADSDMFCYAIRKKIWDGLFFFLNTQVEQTNFYGCPSMETFYPWNIINNSSGYLKYSYPKLNTVMLPHEKRT